MADDHRKPQAASLPRHLPFLTLVLLLLIVFYTFQGPVRSFFSGRYRALATFDRALGIVLEEYVQPRRPEELVRGAIDGMVQSLEDPHSRFLSPKRNRYLKETETGRYVGLGIRIALEEGKVLIVRVFDGSPAEKAGLKAGDLILAAAEHDPQGLQPPARHDLTGLESLEKASDALRGEIGSVVSLEIDRQGKRLQVPVERREIERPLVHVEVEDGLGYLRISDFPDGVHAKVQEGLQRLAEEGVKGLVLDVRQNEGGFLDEAVRVADLFIAQGLIVSTRSRHERDDRTYEAEPGGPAEDLPLVVLVDAFTASAAEVVAGALQDHDRALLVGTKTYGKGAVNKRFPLPDRSGILLTTGRYLLPSGRAIEGKGLEPDVVVQPPGPEVLEKLQPGQEPPDPQREKATALLREQIGSQ
ncbi:MAG: S41 family peptidase [Candidatus Brocadiia bacterium]